MLPFALTISFALIASLVVALTVVPTMGSVLLKRAKPKEHRIFEKIQEVYGVILKFCLRFKILPLGIAIALLALCISAVLNMGIVLIPDMGSDQISVTVTMPEEDEKETVYEKADKVMDAILAVDGVSYVGGMDATGTADMMGMSSGSDSDYGTLTYYVIPDEKADSKEQVEKICADIEVATKDGYNTTLLSRKAQDLLDAYEMPEGYSYEFGGETSNTSDMIAQMGKLMLLGFLLIYLVMVAQFQSLLSPFIVIFTVPLAFTGGLLAMVFSKDTASEMGHGMALVVAGGLFYATFMTMFIVPVMYDILYRKEVHVVDVGGDDMDDVPDDAAEFMEELNRKN